MSGKRRPFDEAAKERIMRSETAKHGRIRPKSFASQVQRLVDRRAAKPPLGTTLPLLER
jgi:hypothetical protein